MSTDKAAPRNKGGLGNRTRLLQPVKQHQTNAGEVDWEKAVQMIGGIMARGLHSTDQAILMAYQLKEKCGEEVAQAFVEGFCCNRSRRMQEMMG